MPNSNLILRTLNSPYGDVNKNSVLSQADVDNNFIFLKGQLIYTASTNGDILTLNKINGDDLSINLSGLTNSTQYWTSGSTGNYSIKTINDTSTDATGDYAVAEGSQTIASGDYSHSEGYDTVASGTSAHAEGRNTLASGQASHAEGWFTTASGDYSHAEGDRTLSSGVGSHAEGTSTTASGDVSHSEGDNTIASGFASHAEGQLTTASNNGSHAEGNNTVASGFFSHAEGWSSQATGSTSHAQGFNTKAYGLRSHAEGSGSIAGGNTSHAEGTSTTASGDYSHAEGNTTTASGTNSHSEGGATTASGQASHSQNYLTVSNGYGSHSGGYGYNNSGQHRVVADGDSSFAHFRVNQTIGDVGAYADQSCILGGLNHNIDSSSTNSGIFGGSSNRVVGSLRSVILGGQNITGTTNDTVYVPYLNISNIGTGTSISNLGFDTNGNVVVGSLGSYAAGPIQYSSGWTSTGTGQMNLPSINVALYDNPNNLGNVKTYTVSSGVTGSGSIPTLTDNDTNYVVVEYNNGSPIYNVYNNDGVVNDSDVILMYVVYRLDNFIHVLEFGNYGAGLVNKLNDRIMMTDRFGWESGLMISLSGSTGVVELSAGVAWNGPYRQTLVGVNSMDDVFFKNYHSGGTWTYTTTGNTINNTYYDNGTDIVSATTGNYLVNYYYRGQEINDHLYEVYGNGEYASVALAEVADSPSLPELITSHAFLVGRIIIEVGATTGDTQTAFGTVFQATGSAPSSGVHNDLTGLQGGAGGEYYHLTSDEYNNNTYGSGTNNYVAKWTPDGSTLGDSIIQDDGVRVAVNGSPSVGDTMRVTAFSGDSTGFFVLRPNYTVSNSNSSGIFVLSISQNSSETLVTGIKAQVSPSTYNTDTGYFGIKGVVGGTLSNPDSDFGLKVGVLGNYEYSTLSGYGVMGQVGGFNQADGVGVKGRFRDNVGDRVNNFIGVVGEVSYGKAVNGRVVNSAIGVYGTVDIYTTSEATSTNVGGKFDAKYSVNGSITDLHALYVDGVSTLSGGTITNGYGLYINSNTVTSGTITNKYGIYQVGSGDTNYFGGNLSVPNVEVRGQSNNPIYAVGTGSSFTLDFDNSNIQTITLSANTTINNALNIKDGATYTVIVKQASGGPYLINSWGTQYKFENGTTPTLGSSGTTAVDILTFISDGTNLYGLIAKNFY